MKFKKSLQTNIDNIKAYSNNNPDIVYRQIKKNNLEIALVYAESLTSSDMINNDILRSINQADLKTNVFTSSINKLKNNLNCGKIKEVLTIKELMYYIFSGWVCLLINKESTVLVTEAKANLDRGVGIPTTEPNIKGPKDAFCENFQTNLGLIQKRIKDNNLVIKDFIVGRRTQTKVAIIYINDIAEIDLVNDLEKKLLKIDVDGILDSSNLRSYITNTTKTTFPTCLSTERPDLAAGALLNGKIVISVENTPFVLILPAFFHDFITPTEDNYQKILNVNFLKIIRGLAFILTVLTPAYYIAIITFNQETIPTSLLINFAAQREGVPFPAFIEALIMMVTFEILKESETRLPSSLGSSISILGALILGDAAVKAGIISPIMVIVIAVTFISSLLFNSVDFVNGARWWRFGLIFLATVAGIYGVFIGAILLVIHLTNVKTFGKPYLYPLAPFNFNGIIDMIFIRPKSDDFYRNPLIASKNIIKQRRKKNEKD